MENRVETLEELATMYMAAKAEKDSAELRMDQRKEMIDNLMEEGEENEVFVDLSEEETIKIKRALRSSRKLNKERISCRLQVEESAINQDFLVKAVADGRLTYDQYKSYYYNENTDNLSIRIVKKKSKKAARE